MLIEVKVPVLSESVSDGVLARWRKKSGEAVARDEQLVDLETDKVMLEIVAPQDGVLKEIKKVDGAIVVSNEVIAIIDTEAKAAAKSTGKSDTKSAKAETKLAAQAAANTDLSPAVRKMVAENKLQSEKIAGTGRDGRITKEDVIKHLDEAKKPAESIPTPPPAMVQIGAGGRPEQRVPMTRLRARIAERLVTAQHTAAMLTSFNEINMKPVMDLRAKYQEAFIKKYDIKLGFMSFFIRACAEALKEYPIINASIDGSDIIYHGYYDIGVAVSTERGLVVPIIRDADRMSIAQLEQSVVNYAKKARDGKLGMDDLSGGTFSITNGGVFGSLMSTPILNLPQSAILGMHKIADRPVVENGQIVIRPMMYVALSYDHRIIDGRDAVSFLVRIKEELEDPARILLEV
ncbi:MAG: 2-oxoglutarate dehydrogenase complex dihydrolipoyllysine-residue succinyltransferase [Gammaproteobacteria bacterium]|nr:2-oxoglutarate dehydrogenase complex dihydrolipoyllysine-residue succinyltransferase [Gammaproteobacteria bacterium]